MFRDSLFSQFRLFPHLYRIGPLRSGKSTRGWSTLFLFGEDRLPFRLHTGTRVAVYQQFADFMNAVFWMDEYKNTIDPQRMQSLKTA
ncbi:hypothetical protein [Spirosoma pollinicola]|uniref:AAA domain-containing protein n=1 Tax=Spirosoma pollinicola TaxID=2057025 RepID=A0A2K8ZAL9_9BACT|nr:hypothetical protein [Spirosoma pollinicola]AUD06927.1 hypothetical protein CWM47_36865 [Spirosoma pollinicola]